MTRSLRAGIIVLLLGGASGCASLQARPTTAAALETPEPPARVVAPSPVEPVSVPPAPMIVPVEQPAPRPAKAPRPRPAAERPEPAVPAASSAPIEPLPSKPTAPPGAALQTTADVDASERRVRELLGRATNDLGQVDYRLLSSTGKAQYDSARRFIQQAEDALRNRNVVFAAQLADKAAGLASGLRGR